MLDRYAYLIPSRQGEIALAMQWRYTAVSPMHPGFPFRNTRADVFLYPPLALFNELLKERKRVYICVWLHQCLAGVKIIWIFLWPRIYSWRMIGLFPWTRM